MWDINYLPLVLGRAVHERYSAGCHAVRGQSTVGLHELDHGGGVSSLRRPAELVDDLLARWPGVRAGPPAAAAAVAAAAAPPPPHRCWPAAVR